MRLTAVIPPIRLKQIILEAPSADDRQVSVQVESSAMTRLGLANTSAIASLPTDNGETITTPPMPVFTTEQERQAARVVMDIISQYAVKRDLVPTSSALLNSEMHSLILAEVTERMKPTQSQLLAEIDGGMPALDLPSVVLKTTEVVVQHTIDIPRIVVVPTGEVTTGFHPFELDVSQLTLQPSEREIIIHNLHTNVQERLASETGYTEQRLENYIIYALMDFDDIDYPTHAELLYNLAGQMVKHLQKLSCRRGSPKCIG